MSRISIAAGSLFLLFSLTFFIIEWYALVPAFILLGLAIMLKKALEPLIVACSVGFMMIPVYGDPLIVKEVFGYGAENGLGFPLNMLAALEDTISRSGHNFGLIWVILLCLLYGALIQLLISSGGISKLVQASEKFVKTKKHSLIMTMVLGMVLFMDDYLNALTVGNTMKSITGKFNVSREKLAMIIALVCVPMTILSPISSWTIFYGSQLLSIDFGAEQYSNPVSAFANVIVFNFSAIVSLLVAVLVFWNVIPDFKGLKRAQEKTEQLIFADSQTTDDSVHNTHGRLWHFFVPLFILLFFTILPYPTEWNVGLFTMQGITSNIDALRGVATAFVITYLLLLFSGAMPFNRISDNFAKGLESMTFVLVILGFTYMLKEVQEVLGFSTFIENKLGRVLNPSLLPAIIFLVVSALGWSTASGWGIYAILMPVTAMLCATTGAHFWLVQGALASGTAWGASACFFSDNRVLIAKATGINIIEHGTTQFPYQLIILVVSTALYLIAGYTL